MKIIFLVIITYGLIGCSTKTAKRTIYSNELSINELRIDSPSGNPNHDKDTMVPDTPVDGFIPSRPIVGFDSLDALVSKKLRAVPERIAKGYRNVDIDIEFTVDTDGTVTNFREYDFDKKYYPKHVAEAERVVRMLPKWIPATHLNDQGKRVPEKSEQTIEIKFPENLSLH